MNLLDDRVAARTIPSMPASNAPAPKAPASQDADLHDYMSNYAPTSVTPKVWAQIAPEAIELVGRAGPMTKSRVHTDLSVLANMVAHLVERGRAVTLDEALSLTSEVTFDAHLQATSPDGRHRQNQRSRLRRLRDVHARGGVRAPRQSTSDRIEKLTSHRLVDELAAVIAIANHSDDPNSADLVAAVAHARAKRGTATHPTSGFRRADAWAFAAAHGLNLTAPRLDAIVTHEVLRRTDPIAVLTQTFELSRRDMELAMTEAVELPHVPNPPSAQVLRGSTRR